MDNITCSICLEKINNDSENIIILKCKHSFHAECLMMNIFILQDNSTKCPLCRCECIKMESVLEKRNKELRKIDDTKQEYLNTLIKYNKMLDKYGNSLELNRKLLEKIQKLKNNKKTNKLAHAREGEGLPLGGVPSEKQ